jgi:hypothetical protein
MVSYMTRTIDDIFKEATEILLTNPIHLSVTDITTSNVSVTAGTVRLSKTKSISTAYFLQVGMYSTGVSKTYIEFESGDVHGPVEVKQLYERFVQPKVDEYFKQVYEKRKSVSLPPEHAMF